METKSVLGVSAVALAIGIGAGLLLSPGDQSDAPTPQKTLTSTTKHATAAPFTATDAEEEGYWYSRYNLGNLVMRSGMGKAVMPDKAKVIAALKAVDDDFDMTQFKAGATSYGDGDHAMPPKNVALISTVYKSGDPHYIAQFDAKDFGTQRWDASKMDTALTGRANGFTILKETEWARQFHVDDHFGTPTSDFGAYWRFVGMMMTMNAKMQTKAFLENMNAYDLTHGGASAMLMALSDLSDLLQSPQLAHSDVPNRYRDTAMGTMIATGADKVFALVHRQNPTSISEQALAIQSLVWYAAKTQNLPNKKMALKDIARYTRTLSAQKPTTASDRAYYLRGLIEAKRTIGLNTHMIRPVAAAFLDDFNDKTGGFDSQDSYTIDQVGAIIGTLNALRIFETADVDADRAEDVFRSFHENIVNKGGLQLSTPPIPVAKSPFEYENEPESYFRYKGQPVPPKAGGTYGIAPVFGSVIAKDGTGWKVTDMRFDTAGAMHTSNEMIWLHYDEINGFPEVNLADTL